MLFYYYNLYSTFYMNIEIQNQIKKLFNEGMAPRTIAKTLNITNSIIYHTCRKIGLKRSIEVIKRESGNKVRKYWPDLTHFQVMDEVACYYLGWIWADGCMAIGKNGYGIAFNISIQARDINILQKFADDMKLSHAIIKRSERNPGHPQCYIGFQHPEFANIMCKHNIDPRDKANYKRHLPKLNYPIDFLRGLIDGDGSIGFYNRKHRPTKLIRVKICITYYEYAVEVLNLISNLLPDITGYLNKVDNIWTICYVGEHANRLLDLLYGNNPCRYIDRKYQTYLEWKKYKSTLPEDRYDSIKIINESNKNEFIQDYNDGMEWKGLATKYGMCLGAIRGTVKRLNLPRRNIPKLTDEQRIEAIKLHKEGETYQNLMDQFNVSYNTLKKILKTNWTILLSPDQIDQFKSDYMVMTTNQLCSKYDVVSATIRNYVRCLKLPKKINNKVFVPHT